MPYFIEKSGKGYYVVNKQTKMVYSNAPIPLSHAVRQMAALYAAEGRKR
jgi:hypothetical protein